MSHQARRDKTGKAALPQFQLRFASWSRSTFPPLRTQTTFEPSGMSTSPWRRAATGAAGPGVGQQAFDLVERVGTSSVVDSLNHIILIAAVTAFVAGVLSLALIRQKDFVVRGAPEAVAVDEQASDRAGVRAG